jgi:hypothetical protein
MPTLRRRQGTPVFGREANKNSLYLAALVIGDRGFEPAFGVGESPLCDKGMTGAEFRETTRVFTRTSHRYSPQSVGALWRTIDLVISDTAARRPHQRPWSADVEPNRRVRKQQARRFFALRKQWSTVHTPAVMPRSNPSPQELERGASLAMDTVTTLLQNLRKAQFELMAAAIDVGLTWDEVAELTGRPSGDAARQAHAEWKKGR